MTQTVDKRIVEMSFENGQFEKGVGTSLSTIDRLKKALHFGDAAKSFDGISASANRVNLGSIGTAADHVAGRFSAMGIIAITTLVNIANSAYQAAARITKALTIEPIKLGLDEYETKLGSIQTILANTQKEGTNLETVTKALDTLNEYSDQTIYNFQQMARNIGTFTAAGIKLDTSVSAIKGIANLAAISGSNADQASTAMYQLSQALSTGTVRLMDWNSVVNAGMGGQVFQDAIMETARVHGVAVDQIIKEEGSFRDSLQRGWFTSEILTETLSKFTGDLNREQLLTMGYTEDQIAAIIKMGQTASDAATKVKTFTQLFSTLKEAAQSGWAKTWEIVIGDFEEAKAFLTDLNNFLGGIIGSAADARNALLQGWKDLGGRDDLIAALKNIMDGIISIIGPIKEAFREFFPPTTAKNLKDITQAIEDFTEKFKMGAKEGETIKKIFRGVFAIFDIGKTAVVAFLKQFGLLVGSYSEAGNGLVDFLVKIADWLVGLRDAIKEGNTFTIFFENLAKVIKSVIDGIGEFVAALTGGFRSTEKEASKSKSLANFLDTLASKFKKVGGASTTTSKFFTFLSKLAEKIGPIVGKISEKIGELFDSLLDSMTRGLEKMDTGKVLDVINKGLTGGVLVALTSFVNQSKSVIGGGLFAGILLSIKKFIDEGGSVFTGVKGILDSVRGSLDAYQKTLKANALLKIAGAIGILAASILVLSLVDSEKLVTATAAIGAMFVGLATTIDIFEKTTAGGKRLIVLTASVMGISAALLVLAGAVFILSKLDPSEAAQGVAAISGVLALLLLFQKYSKSTGTIIDDSLGLIVFASAMTLLSESIKKFGSMDIEELAKGLLAMGTALGIIGVAMKAMTGVLTGAGSLVLAAGAMLILAFAMEKLGNLSLEQVGVALLALAGALVVLGVAGAVLTPIAPTIALVAVSILAIGAAVLAAGVGIGAFALGLAAVAAGILALSGVTAAGVAAITLLVTGIAALIPMLAVQAVKGIEAFLVQLSKSAPRIALALIGIGLEILKGLEQILPEIVTTVLSFVTKILEGFAESTPRLVQAGYDILLGFLDGIHNNIEDVVIVVVGIIKTFADTVSQELPVLADSGWKLIIAWIDAMKSSVEENMPVLIDSVRELGIAVVKGIITGLVGGHGDARQAIRDIGKILIDAFKAMLGISSPSTVFSVMAGDIIRGLANGLKNNVSLAITEITNLARKIVDALKEKISGMYNAGRDLVLGLSNGIKSAVGEVIERARRLALSVLSTIANVFQNRSPSKKMIEQGKFLDEGLAIGIRRFGGVVLQETKNIGTDVMAGFNNTIASISESLTSNLDASPTIRPVIDLSEIEKGGNLIDQLLSGKRLDVSLATIKAASISSAVSQPSSESVRTESPEASSINFTQNNYSPKALSRIEIYRQTRNQLSQVKELVGV